MLFYLQAYHSVGNHLASVFFLNSQIRLQLNQLFKLICLWFIRCYCSMYTNYIPLNVVLT